MNLPSQSDRNSSPFDDVDGFLDPSVLPPLRDSAKPDVARPDSARPDVARFEEMPSLAEAALGDSSVAFGERAAATATAVAEPPAPPLPLSKKEQKAQAKAAKAQAQAQARADKAQAKADQAQAKIDQATRRAEEKAERKAAKAAAKQAQREQRKTSFWYRSSGLLLRLLGLGIAGSLAAVGGITVASFIAAPPSEDAPLLERGLTGTSDGLSATQRLPQRLIKGLAQRLDPDPKPRLEAAAPILSEPQRQQLIAESNALRQELAQISQRAIAVEQQLGYDYSTAAIEQRLATITQTLADPNGSPQTAAPTQGRPAPLVMTLPTDPMFDDEQSALKPGANAILGTLLGEMRAYDRAIVTVSVHSDGVGDDNDQRELSLRRAQVVSNYLRSQIGDAPGNLPSNRFTWNPVGAGNTLPLVANDSNENRQRNRRIEIRVTPQ